MKIVSAIIGALVALAVKLGGATPVVTLHSPSAQTVNVGTTVTIIGSASDNDGNMNEHWLEVRRPAGDWSWEGWLMSEPFGPALNGGSYSSYKSGDVVLSDVGTYVFRTTATDDFGASWQISNEVTVNVIAPQGHIHNPTTISVGTWTVNFSINDNGVVAGSKTYANRQDGNYSVYYEVRDATAGPGYVIWYEIEAFNDWQTTQLSYANHKMILARYIRSSRSWVISTVGSLRTGYMSSWMYGDQHPLSLNPTSFSWRTTYNQKTYPYTAHNDPHSYSIPTQPL